jgi:hypothetical protein
MTLGFPQSQYFFCLGAVEDLESVFLCPLRLVRNLELIHVGFGGLHKILEFLIGDRAGGLRSPHILQLVVHAGMEFKSVTSGVFLRVSVQVKILGVDMLRENRD